MFKDSSSINGILMKDLLYVHKGCIVAFKCDKTMRIQIVRTNSLHGLLESYTTLLSQDMHPIKALNEDKLDIVVSVLELHDSSMYLKYMVNLYNKEAINSGYTLYDNSYNLGDYSFHEVISGEEYNVSLYIRGKSRALSQMVLVGKFKSKVELEAYKALGLEACLKSIKS